MKNNIKAYRKARGLTLNELARYSRVSASQLSQIERGEAVPTLMTAYKLSYVLKHDVYNLFPPDYAREALRDIVKEQTHRYRVLLRKKADGLKYDVEILLQKYNQKQWVDVSKSVVTKDGFVDYTFVVLLAQAMNDMQESAIMYKE